MTVHTRKRVIPTSAESASEIPEVRRSWPIGKPFDENPGHYLHVVLVSGKGHELAIWAEEVVFGRRESKKPGSWSSTTRSGV